MDKKYKVLLICLFVYLIIIGIIVLLNQNEKDASEALVFVDNYSRWIYTDGKWNKVNSKEISEYSWKKYDVYDSNGFVGNNYLMKNDGSNEWHIFDDEKKSVQVIGNFVAFGGEMKHDIKNFKIGDISSNEISYVQEVLSDLNIKDNNVDNFTVKDKYLVDLDNGSQEEFYCISNAFSNKVREKDFSIIFLRKNNQNIIMYKSIEDAPANNIYSGCAPTIQSVFMIGKDKNPKFIVNCEFFSGTSLYNKLYNYDLDNNKFNNVLTDFYKQ